MMKSPPEATSASGPAVEGRASAAREGRKVEQVFLKGRRVALESRGKGEPVILIHGWNSTRLQWLYTLRALSPRFRIICPDLPGCGDSDDAEEYPYTPEGMIAYIEDLRRVLHLPSFHLVGHSLGGCIAAHYAAEHGDRVKSLVLVSTPSTRLSMGLRALLPGGAAFVSLTYRLRSDKVLKWMFYRGVYAPEYLDLDFVRANVAAASRTSRKALTESARMALRVNLDPVLPKITNPTLIVFGDRDKSVNPREAERQKRMIEGALVVILTKCAHCPPYERPGPFNNLLGDFLSGGGGRLRETCKETSTREEGR
jgi:pimeloyl-ACP methyl ester carboxylesterase